MNQEFDHIKVGMQASEDIENGNWQTAAEKLRQLIAFYENAQATEYMEYLEYQYALSGVYLQLDDRTAALATLRKLTDFFDKNVDPNNLKPTAKDVFAYSWVRMAALYKDSGNIKAAMETYDHCIPMFIDIFGPNSDVVEQAKELQRGIVG